MDYSGEMGCRSQAASETRVNSGELRLWTEINMNWIILKYDMNYSFIILSKRNKVQRPNYLLSMYSGRFYHLFVLFFLIILL